jgi:hypothetical protein
VIFELRGRERLGSQGSASTQGFIDEFPAKGGIGYAAMGGLLSIKERFQLTG